LGELGFRRGKGLVWILLVDPKTGLLTKTAANEFLMTWDSLSVCLSALL
jgi:hypothetical protein